MHMYENGYPPGLGYLTLCRQWKKGNINRCLLCKVCLWSSFRAYHYIWVLSRVWTREITVVRLLFARTFCSENSGKTHSLSFTSYCAVFADSRTTLYLSCTFCRIRHALLNQLVIRNIGKEVGCASNHPPVAGVLGLLNQGLCSSIFLTCGIWEDTAAECEPWEKMPRCFLSRLKLKES